jgi:hypothetical protein
VINVLIRFFCKLSSGYHNDSEAGTTGASLASAFTALPDVAEESRGCSVVLDPALRHVSGRRE